MLIKYKDIDFNPEEVEFVHVDKDDRLTGHYYVLKMGLKSGNIINITEHKEKFPVDINKQELVKLINQS